MMAGAGRHVSLMISLGLASGLGSQPGDARAAVHRATPETYRAIVRALEPGDRLLLAPGDYKAGLSIRSLHGTRERPIRIGAEDPQRRPRFLGRTGRNTVSIVDSAHVEIADLELDGRSLAVDAVKAEGHARYAHHITLRNLRIVGHGADQQTVAISTKCPAWGWEIRDNVIVGAGTGMYLGNSDGSAPFVAGLIEGNVIRDSIGYNLQVKHQNARPALPGMPDGRSVTVIRRNVFMKGAGSATEKLARPNLLVGHFPPSGPGADDAYLVYGNFFFGNPTEALFQGEGNIAFYNNVLVNPDGSAIHVQPHNGVPEAIDVFFNTVLARDGGIRVTGGHPAKAQRVRANVVFADRPVEAADERDNFVGAWTDAGATLRAPYAAGDALDLRPRAGVLPALRADAIPGHGLPDAALDFDARPRGRVVAGAFAEETGATAPLRLPRQPKR